MAIIDDKVVAMSFENRKFESGVHSTISALDKLKAALNFPNAGKGLDDVNRASKRVNLSHIASSLDDIKNKFSVLSIAGIAVLSNLAIQAVRTGARMASAFTIDPIKAGLQEYTTNLNAVQTILANTQASGATLKDVNKALQELNLYSDKTIYNFSQMAKNIGTFTAAGVDLKTSTASIKGIANLAALSGSNAEQASTAMYQLSQAIASGRVSLMDWNSVVNAGMGGTVFQRALAQTAEAMGTLKDGAVKLEGPMKNVKINGESFRESIGGPGPKWLTSDVLTNTLKQFTSDMSVAELKAQGFNDAQIKAIQATAKTAMLAATQVKTLGGVLDVAKETAQSGWAQTWQIIFGDFGEAKKTFTDLSNSINGFINASANARNKVLGDWKELGGRKVLIDSIKIAFDGLRQILTPIKEAFRDIFPAQTGKSLYDLTLRFKEFAKSLTPSIDTMVNLHRTFEGIFAIFDIGKQIVSGIFNMFKQLFKTVGGGSGSFLSFTAKIGDFFVSLDNALKKGDAFNNFFVKMGAILAVPIQFLGRLAAAIGSLFDDFSPGGFSSQMGEITKSAQPFQKIVTALKESLKGLGTAISNALSGMNFEAILEVIKVGLLGGLVLMIKNFLGGDTFAKAIAGIGGGIFKNLRGVTKNMSKMFGSLAGSMQAMQQNIQARTLKEIAIAIALLAASVLMLSLVDPDRLDEALTAMTIGFAELLGAMKFMSTMGKAGAAKIPVIAASLIMLAAALDLLAIAVIAFSRLSWEQLAKGLGAVDILLVTISNSTQVLAKNSVRMIAAGTAITIIAGAMLILAQAVEMFGSMDLVSLGKGLLGVGGSLAAIGRAMELMPKNMVVSAAGILIVALALGKIASAVEQMGGMAIGTIAKGIIGLSLALDALAFALRGMTGALAGAAALTVAAVGISLLTKSIITLSEMSGRDIARGVINLALALGTLAVSAALMSSAVPAMLALGVALLAIGAALALAGAGIALMGVGLASIAVAGPAAIGILVQALIQLTKAIPEVVQNVVLGLLSMVEALAKTAPQFVDALVKILNSLLDVVIQASPKIAEAFNALLTAALNILYVNKDRIIKAGFDLLMSLLNGIKNNIAQVTQTVIDIITRFLATLTANLGKLITAGVGLLVALLDGIGNNLARVTTAALSIVTKFLAAIASNLVKIITAGTNVIVAFVQGIANAGEQIITAAVNAMGKFINAMVKASLKLVDIGAQAIIKFLNGVADAIEKYEPQMLAAGARIGVAIVKGLVNGLASMAQSVYNKAKEIMDNVLSIMHKIPLIGSPSRVTADLGKNIVLGLVNGINATAPQSYAAATTMANGLIGVFNTLFEIQSPSKVMERIGQYVGDGFAKGLRGSAENINSAFTDLNNKLTSAMSTARETIAKEQDKLDKLREAKKPDLDAIKKVQEIINENEVLLAKSTAAHELLTTTLRKSKNELISLTNEYDKVGEKLKAAKDALAEVTKIRDDAVASYSDQYATLPTIEMVDKDGNPIDPATQVANYLAALNNQQLAVRAYATTLDQLRELGLDDATYKKLLEEGTADQSFANQLLAGGKTAVEGLNTLDKQLQTVSKRLGTNAANNLFQAGVDAAQGIVDGLESKENAIRKEMEKIGRQMLAALNSVLKSHSPSKEFATIGGFAMEGLAIGFRNSTKLVTDSITNAADSAMAALKRSMSNMSRFVSDNLDASPVITPVLDLSQVQSKARDLANLANVVPITAAASFGQASVISSEQTAVQEELATPVPGGTSVKFEQNNYSPEALSEVEIYRQTKNQLSQLKSALDFA